MACGEDVGDLLPNDSRIRAIHVEGQPPIGAKRNLGAENARGSVICHWDDDDWSGPERISDQVRRLHESGLPVTGYRSMRFTDGTKSWLYRHSNPLFAVGTSLCYLRSWWQEHPFQSKQVGEDNHFVEEAIATRAIVSVDASEMMYATIHPSNTSPRLLNSTNWTPL